MSATLVTTPIREGFTTLTPHVMVREAGLVVYVEDVDAAFDRALAAGGASLGVPEDRPYGERSGFIKDEFGNHWYISTHLGRSPIPEGLRTATPFVHAPAPSASPSRSRRPRCGAVEDSIGNQWFIARPA